ncbi:hypothetical protein COLO4_38582 [Corchorus olitorius]|uniref:F-box/LRR-repeat protein 15/At3g58940/PEG3-like LRR domain-containing protein n=1 Tax=Corchorus olitorius TaxID=93759 RepID=A0A1R3FU23_9ROSI|nr:hypothetical protein COLO4_38582 [Corchorus olitorius]
MRYALNHNVQEFTIYWYFEGEFVLPETFYTCTSLTALQLHGTIKLPKFLALPALRSLHLNEFLMTKDSFNPGNFSGCPNLETLELIDIICLEKDKTLFINAPNLKRLQFFFGQSSIIYEHKVVIDAPGLITSEYTGLPLLQCLSDDLACVDHAYFDIHDWNISKDEGQEGFVDMYSDEFRERVLGFMDTLKKFCHAKSLTLSLETVEALAIFPAFLDENRSPFANLKYLKIKRKPWQSNKVRIPGCVLNYFLNSSTMLELCE